MSERGERPRALAPRKSEAQTMIATCCVTGKIAGDLDACGDCDPCIMGASTVPDAVKRLLKEKDEWRNKYGEAAAQVDEIERLRAALKPFAAIKPSIIGGLDSPVGYGVIIRPVGSCDFTNEDLSRARAALNN